MPPFLLPDLDEVPVHVEFTRPNPVTEAIEQVPVTNITAVSSDVAVLTVSAVPPGPASELDLVVSAAGQTGVALLTVTGQNPDGTTITGSQEFSVIRNATTATLTIGTPYPKA